MDMAWIVSLHCTGESETVAVFDLSYSHAGRIFRGHLPVGRSIIVSVVA